MERKPTTVRLTPNERRLLRTAARRRGEVHWTSWFREAALEAAVEVVETDLPDLEPSRDAADRGD